MLFGVSLRLVLFATLFYCSSGCELMAQPPSDWRPFSASASCSSTEDKACAPEASFEIALQTKETKKYLLLTFSSDEVEMGEMPTQANLLQQPQSLFQAGADRLQSISDEKVRVDSLTLSYRHYFLVAPDCSKTAYNAFAQAGAGLYALDFKDSGIGWRIGGGFGFSPFKDRRNWQVEVTGTYHHVRLDGDNLGYASVGIGVRFRWDQFKKPKDDDTKPEKKDCSKESAHSSLKNLL